MSYEQLAASVDALSEANGKLKDQVLATQVSSNDAVDAAKSQVAKAQQAADAAQIAAKVYDTAAAGLAATAVNGYFNVVASDNKEFLILYKNNAGAALEIKRYPSAYAVLDIKPDIYDQSGRSPLIRNLFDLSRTTDGFYVNTVGEVSSDALYYISDFIPVLESQQYVFSVPVSSIGFYSLSKNFISRQAGATAGSAFTTPSSAQFVRFSQPLSTKKTKQMLIKGSTLPASYIGFGYTDPATQDKKTHSATLSLISDLTSGVANLFDMARTTDGVALSTDGSTYSQAGYFVSRFIPIKPSTSFIMSASSSVVCFYDSNQVRIANISVVNKVSFVSPSDACYLRFQMTPLTAKNALMLIEGTVLPSSYIAFGSPTNASVSKTALEVARSVAYGAQPLTRNVFDMNRAKLDTSISAINGGTSSAAGYFITGKLPVVPGDSFVSTFGPNNLCFYDSSESFISGSTAYNGYGNIPVPVPSNAYFIQFQVSPLTRLQSLMVTQGSTVPAGYVPFGGVTSKLPWQDKKLVILGDSISATGLYIPSLVSGTGMSLLANHAVAGRAVRDMGKTTAGIKLQVSDLSNVDFVSIFGGTNDYGGGRVLGTLADAYSGSTVASFYNDVYQLLALIYTLKPSIRIVFSTPLKRGAFEDQPVYPALNGVGVKLEQYVDAIVEVCNLFSVPVCNLFRDGGFNMLNLSVNTSDNLHPNPAGSSLHVRPMIATINAS